MRRGAIDGHIDIKVRHLAENILSSAGVASKDYRGEVEAIQAWVRENIRYTRDPYFVETLISPAALIDSRQGDCDDHSMLVASLLLSVGFKPRFVAIGYTPGTFEHVLTEVRLGTKWVTVETTEPVAVGWQYAPPVEFMVENF